MGEETWAAPVPPSAPRSERATGSGKSVRRDSTCSSLRSTRRRVRSSALMIGSPWWGNLRRVPLGPGLTNKVYLGPVGFLPSVPPQVPRPLRHERFRRFPHLRVMATVRLTSSRGIELTHGGRVVTTHDPAVIPPRA